MRIVSMNLNGIRAAGRKGFFTGCCGRRLMWCPQELKAQKEQILGRLYWPPSFQCNYHPAERKSYSGWASTAGVRGKGAVPFI